MKVIQKSDSLRLKAGMSLKDIYFQKLGVISYSSAKLEATNMP